LILIDALYFAYWEKEKKKKRNDHGAFFSRGPDMPCSVRFSWLLGAIKGQSLNLSAPNVMVVVILARSNQNYPIVTPMSQDGFWSHRA
jgi:hypothetical protein